MITPQYVETDEENIIIRCNIPTGEVARHYRAADFLIHPSRTESGMCHTILEAMASNLPLILSKYILHDLPCGIDYKSLGIVIEDHQVNNYVAAVQRFIDAPLIVNSRQIVQQYFSLELFTKHYQDLIDQLLKEAR